MSSRISELTKKIDELYQELKQEYQKAAEKYGFKLSGRKVVFMEAFREKNKKFKENLLRYVFTAKIRHLLSMPFIYSMIVPVVILDIFLWIYQTCAFPLYGIPKAKRRDYIIYDRKFLDYLNLIQKIHCLYCTYANGLFAYAVEIAGRTERYWCPIKAANHPKAPHSQYADFADYGDAEGFKEKFNEQDLEIK